jgi:environmental stress-induced protein Ves
MMERIPAAAYQRMVWKNGLGVTEQIAVSPEGATLAGGFSYRISRAQVMAGGPFSAFPGCDRILTVIEGHGLSLRRRGETTALALLEPFRFSGDEAISAMLERGPITDFNVIFDRARIDASCELLLFDEHPCALLGERPGTEHVFHCLRGGLVCEGVTLESGESARARFEPGSQPNIFARAPSSLALHVRLWSR